MCIRDRILTITPLSSWPSVYVCCSGAFQVDRGVAALVPDKPIHSNDVSLLSCALGRLAEGGQEEFTFTGELAFIEDLLKDEGPVKRAAGLLVALAIAPFAKRNNDYQDGHYRYYVERFAVRVSNPVGRGWCVDRARRCAGRAS